MTAPTPSTAPNTTFDSLKTHLLSLPAPLFPPAGPHDPALTDPIASLQLHPTLEALLHLLNRDLPSAHFLVRHMQAAPAHAAMYAHGLLHRLEGDYDNARAWYADVADSPVFRSVWGRATDADAADARAVAQREGKAKVPAQRAARDFLDAVEALVRRKKKGTAAAGGNGDDARDALERESRREIEALMDWCVAEFGTERVPDATAVWVRPSDEIKDIGNKMTTGGEGHRKF
ncbi:hypothetical protein MBLNU459_g5218t1 [Dothideomycetes sp. NU459]